MAPDDDKNWKPINTGERGPQFREWLRNFQALSRGKFAKDDRYSFVEAYKRKDEGGTDAGAPALPAATGGAGGRDAASA